MVIEASVSAKESRKEARVTLSRVQLRASSFTNSKNPSLFCAFFHSLSRTIACFHSVRCKSLCSASVCYWLCSASQFVVGFWLCFAVDGRLIRFQGFCLGEILSKLNL